MPDYPASWHRASKPKRPKRVTPEGAVLKAITDLLRALHIGHVVRAQVGMARYGEHGEMPVPYGERGESDLRVELPLTAPVSPIYGPLAGRTLYIEVKRPGGKLTTHQEAFLARQMARGCPALVASSADEVRGFLVLHGFALNRRAA